MIPVLFKALAVASAGTVAVGMILLTLVLLSTPAGLRKASSFCAAYALSYSSIGIGAWLLGERLRDAPGDGGDGRGGSWAALAVGVLMLSLAVRTLRRPHEDMGAPKLLQKIDEVTARRLFLLGLFLPAVNIKNLAVFLTAMSIVVAGRLPLPQAMLCLALIVLVFCAGLILPIVLFAIGRARVAPLLARLRSALERHTRALALGILSVFGTAFVVRGLFGLWS